MNTEIIYSYEYDENCYLIYDEKGTGAVIDPGARAEDIIKKAGEKGVKIAAILLTHCHYDHTASLKLIKNAYDARVYSSFNCNINIQNPSINLSGILSDNSVIFPQSDVILTDGEEFYIGDIKIKAIETPGHTSGGMCYLAEDELFSGDTLFLRSIGRTDFPTGDHDTLISSVKEKLYSLNGDTVVHPGHGKDTKIFYEKLYNVFVR